MSQRYTGSNSSAASFALAGASAHSACGWVYVQSAAPADVCYCDDAGGGADNNSIWVGFDGTNFRIRDQDTGGPGSFDFTQAVVTNTWTHLALTYDGTNCRAYINGALVGGPTAINFTGRAAFDHMDIGYGGDFTAQDVMVFASALSQAQVQAAMRLTAPVAAYAWYPLTDAAPTADASGNGRTLSNAGDANGSQRLIAGTGAIKSAGSGVLTAAVALTGAAGTKSAASGTATEAVALTGSAGIKSAATGQATVSVALSGSAGIKTAASGTLSTGGSTTPIDGTGAIHTAASGSVTAAGALGGAAAIRSAASGTLTVQVALDGTSGIRSAASASQTMAALLTGTAGVRSGAAGTITGGAVPVPFVAAGWMPDMPLSGAAHGAWTTEPLSGAPAAHSDWAA